LYAQIDNKITMNMVGGGWWVELNCGQDSLVGKALDYRPKGTGFDPRLDHKRRST
jgi:hypothetical protein